VSWPLLITLWSIDALTALLLASVTPVAHISVDAIVVGFGVLVAMLSVMLLGLAPALHTARADLHVTLKDAPTHSAASLARQRMRGALVVAQCALALVLLTGAALLVRTFQHLSRVELGFRPDHILTARIWMPQPNDPSTGPYFTHEQRMPFYRAVEAGLRALPGAETVGWVSTLPLINPVPAQLVLIDGRPLDERSVATAELLRASASYFDSLRIELTRGRMFTESDDAKAAPVAVVNEAFVRQYFSTEEPVGRRFRPGGSRSTAPWRTIVGVVRDVRTRRVDLAALPQVYVPHTQVSGLFTALVIRTRGGDPATLADAVRREVPRIDPDIPVYGIDTMQSVIAASTSQRRFAATLLLLFAGFALALASVGLYAVIAYLVTQRTHEIGVRIALGARRVDVLRIVLGYGAGLAVCGALIGLVVAVPLTPLMRSLLFQVSATDPLVFILLPVALCVVAVLASYVPARWAIRINPIEALRYE
jgi:putative ABC transport system permease protein